MLLEGMMIQLNNTQKGNYIREAEKENAGVIRKVGNKWRILKKNRKDYWDAEYKTKKNAQAALRAYWANKRECCKHTTEGFNSYLGNDLIKKVQSFLIKIFGPTLYFDHITDNSADLYYHGNEIAELSYDNNTEEVVILPENKKVSPVKFYDTSIYEISDYLSDLLLGDIEPQYT